jgi:RNA polymerase sigma-70 factor (ECF subfamily)
MQGTVGVAHELKKEDIIAVVPRLRAFALSMCRDSVRAEDLVQEAVLRCLIGWERFEPGTNLTAWLLTVVRNEYFTQLRRQRFEIVADLAEGLLPAVAPHHDSQLHLRDLKRAMDQLPPDQREALLFVSARGYSYEEAAEICGCRLGTIKSRVARARERLMELLQDNEPAQSSTGPGIPLDPIGYATSAEAYC